MSHTHAKAQPFQMSGNRQADRQTDGCIISGANAVGNNDDVADLVAANGRLCFATGKVTVLAMPHRVQWIIRLWERDLGEMSISAIYLMKSSIATCYSNVNDARRTAATAPCTDRSVVFARWRPYFPHLRHGSLLDASRPKRHLDQFNASAVFTGFTVVTNTQTDHMTYGHPLAIVRIYA